MVKSPFVWAVVELPGIRHSPQEDNPEIRDGISISDSTGMIGVFFPQGEIRRLANDLSKARDTTFDPKLLKARLWISDVVILAGYNEELENVYYLVHTKNRLAREPHKERVPLSPNPLRLGRIAI